MATKSIQLNRMRAVVTGSVAFLAPSVCRADVVSPGDTAWMLTATALVLFMTIPGLSLLGIV